MTVSIVDAMLSDFSRAEVTVRVISEMRQYEVTSRIVHKVTSWKRPTVTFYKGKSGRVISMVARSDGAQKSDFSGVKVTSVKWVKSIRIFPLNGHFLLQKSDRLREKFEWTLPTSLKSL
jgi:hypothetical protein